MRDVLLPLVHFLSFTDLILNGFYGQIFIRNILILHDRYKICGVWINSEYYNG